MFGQKCSTLHKLTPQELLVISEVMCCGSTVVLPIYECVKIFARLNSDQKFTYARHPDDLGSDITTHSHIVQRFRNEERSKVVLEALQCMESTMSDCWPFAPGSSSWIQLEILDPSIRMKGPVNKPTIVFRRAVRLSRLSKRLSISSTPLIENIFSSSKSLMPEFAGRFKISFAPQLKLKNLAGSGLMSESRLDISCIELGEKTVHEVAENIIFKVLESNFAISPEINPGFYMTVAGKEYRAVTSAYQGHDPKILTKNKVLPPLPIIGLLK